MNAIAKPFLSAFRLPQLARKRHEASLRRRKQTTLDLVHASPYLRRDIGLDDQYNAGRHQ